MATELAKERLGRVLDLCRERGWQALLVYGNAWRCDYFRYISNFSILEGHGFALLTAEGDMTLFLESPLEAERAEVEANEGVVVSIPNILAEVASRIEHLGNARIGTAPAALMPSGVAEVAGAKVENATAALDLLLLQKTAHEIEAVRRAARMADAGYEIFRAAAQPGRAEYEVLAEVEAFFRARGCPDNFMIVGSGGREVRGMHPPGERRIRVGDLVTTELTPCVEGYYAQLCRTLVVGTPTAEQHAAFDLFLESMQAGLAAVRPGARAGDVARSENDVFRARDLGIYTTSEYTRVRGHGLGLFPDAQPALLEEVDTPLVSGMTIIVHPNTYHPEVGYMVLGDTLVVRPNGPEILSATPRTLFAGSI